MEALVVGVELDDGGDWMSFFVTLTDGARPDEALRQRILAAIRRAAGETTVTRRRAGRRG
ncbi:hypothetical protein G3I59_32665 [Amycolatopsis rubida]|uniref:Uncharacterized protein n=1 Tax=Amycolatopsis rubida TaxID=112413 RepID=A0ABX0C1Z8_9PSEU|nr:MULTISPECIES: hypothetical protein [Amycolatopsis]MYW95225.1 hypothetical protein [Amycolatopsis rubida]NEC60213.1 hypothetical protein [Amycolatopsis rubida]